MECELDLSLDLANFDGVLNNNEECILLVVDEECAGIKSDSQFVLSNELGKWLNSLTKMLEDLAVLDPVAERRSKVQKDILAAISCYLDISEERLISENTDLSESLSVSDNTEEYELTKQRKKEKLCEISEALENGCKKEMPQARYPCEFCAVSFTSPLYLKEHMDCCANCWTQPMQSLYCAQCGIYFSNKYNQSRHMVKHIIKNKSNPNHKRLKLADLKRQDIDKAIAVLSNTSAEINGHMEIITKLKKDGKIEFENGEIIDKISLEKLKSEEEGEIGVVKGHDNVPDEYQVQIEGDDIPNAAKKANLEENPLESTTLDLLRKGKMIEESEDKIRLIEKHKLGIITDHILRNRNQYWSDVELQCVCCGYISASPDECEDHMRDKHKSDKPFACNYCDQCFISITRLRKHTLENHKVEADGESIYLRKHTSSKKNNLKQINLKMYRCRVCEQKFNRADVLKSHERRHLGVIKTSKTGEIVLTKQKTAKPPSLSRIGCEICGGSYSTRSNLRKHMAVHIGEPRYSCQHCGKTFLKSDCLTYHLRIHTKEKPWKCDICFESFSDRRNWLIHSNNHKGLRPYKCEGCPMRYVDRRLLNKHIATVHNGQFEPKPVYQHRLKETQAKHV